MDEPRVTLALPLYKSMRFLDIIIANLESLDYGNLEILISDRHCADDALERLRARFGNDARFHFMPARDEINWVEHYNLLLRAASGKYFFWMPHDDSYAREYVRVLVGALETYPDAVLAYGNIIGLYPNGLGKPPGGVAPFLNDAAWTWREPFKLFFAKHLWVAFRGVVRRRVVIQQNLFLPATRDTNAADMVWTFALACSGRFVWTPECLIQKRFYGSSTHAQWKLRTWRHTLTEFARLRALLWNDPASPRARLRAELLASLWTCLRFGGNTLDTLHVSPIVDQRLRRFFLQMNLW